MKTQRILSLLLAMCILIGSAPVFAMATEPPSEVLTEPLPEIQTGPTTEPSVQPLAEAETEPEADPASGTCGEELTWTYADGTLTISGTGQMDSYSAEEAPWYGYADSILSIVVEDGVTGIGSSNFYGLYNAAAVTLPATLEQIGSEAFSDCSSLESIQIPEGVASIVYGTFRNCSSLKTVQLCEGMYEIGYAAFQNCSSLESFEVPATVRYIGSSAFEDCTRFKTISMPEGVVSIGSGAFAGCTSLEAIEIPATVTEIGYRAFEGCSSLKSVTIPDGITTIESSTFEDCDNLETVTIPDSVSYFDSYCFYYCSNLKSIRIPDGTTSIGYSAFHGCSSLTSINIPDSVTNISSYAFESCSSLETFYGPDVETWCSISLGNYASTPTRYAETIYMDGEIPTEITIPENITSIRPYTFYQFDTITSVTLPDGITSIGDSAFSWCTALETINIPDGVTSIGESAFSDCRSLTAIVLPDSVTSIGESAFMSCEALTSANIPNGVTAIPDRAFYCCYALTDITIGSGVTSIGTYAFNSCESLKNVTLPEGLLSIGNSFRNCTALESINIPSTVTSIDSAFSYCSSLKYIFIPAGVTSISSSAFTDCTSLTAIDVDPANTVYSSDEYGVLFNKDQTELICLPGAITECSIPAGLTSINAYRFSYCRALEAIHVDPANEVFAGGEDGIVYNKEMTQLIVSPVTISEFTIPDTVTSIGEYAFYDRANLKTITIPEQITFIGADAFAYCTGVETLYFNAAAVSDFGSYEAPFSYVGRGVDSTHLVVGANVTRIPAYMFYPSGSSSQHANITDVVFEEGSVCESIGKRAFYYCYNLTSVEIPASMTDIANDAFIRCFYLETLDVDPANPAYSSDSYGALYNKAQTELVMVVPVATQCRIPDTVTTIADGAFRNCSELTSVSIPGSVTSIGTGLFTYCSSLKNVTFGSGITVLPEETFYECTALTSVILPDTLTSIGTYAFYNCKMLPWLNLPASLTTIEDNAFIFCNSLERITIPAGVTAIEEDAFWACHDLSIIRFLGDAPAISDYAFQDVTADAYYPADNATWTAEMMLDYGGEITWIPYDAGEKDYQVTYTNASISLAGDIGVNYYAQISEDLVNDPCAYMQFTVDGLNQIVPLSQAEVSTDANGVTSYRFTCKVAAKQMTDEITGQVYASSGEAVGEAKVYSVKAYCDAAIPVYSQYPAYANLVSLMEAMLNYGGYSQTQFGYHTDRMANAGLNIPLPALTAEDVVAYAHGAQGSEPGIRVSSVSLLLESTTTIRFYFTLDEGYYSDEFTFCVDGEEVQPVWVEGNLYYVDKADVAAKDLDEMVTVTVGGLTARYCGLSYVRQVAVLYPNYYSAALVNVAKALYAYNQAANAHFGA